MELVLRVHCHLRYALKRLEMSNLGDEEVEWEDVDDEWEVQCKEGGLTDHSLDDAFDAGDDSLALGTDTGGVLNGVRPGWHSSEKGDHMCLHHSFDRCMSRCW